jgi:hypothetical protein
MNNYPKFYKPTEFLPVEFDTLEQIEARLDMKCEEHKFHKWLYLPKERGQKQYLFCLNCHSYSHT